MENKKEQSNHEGIMKLLDSLYETSVKGIPKISPPIEQLANDYLSKSEDSQKAAKSFIKYQIAKCTTSGFLTGLGGFITLPVAIPANVGSVLYVQMRMVACLAHMGGYDLNSDQVQTLVYACMAGISLNQVAKQMSIKFGTKFAKAQINKIPGKVLTKINQKVGFRFLTKAGKTGVLNLIDTLPLVGGIVGGGFDFAETKAIGKNAYKMFILNDFSEPIRSKRKMDDNLTVEIDDSDFDITDNIDHSTAEE